MCTPGQIQLYISDWKTHEVRKFIEWDFCLNLASYVVWAASYFFSLGVKIQTSTRICYIPSKIVHKFPAVEALLHQIELCAVLKWKRIKNAVDLTQAGMDMMHIWFLVWIQQASLFWEYKCILLPQAYGSNTCNLHPIWGLFQATVRL